MNFDSLSEVWLLDQTAENYASTKLTLDSVLAAGPPTIGIGVKEWRSIKDSLMTKASQGNFWPVLLASEDVPKRPCGKQAVQVYFVPLGSNLADSSSCGSRLRTNG